MPIEFAYAQARAQARQGDRLSEDSWGLLESSVGLAQYLHLVRGTTLAVRVEHFSAATSPHVIERFLRQEWRREVASAVRWTPLRWRAAVAWTARLVDLPAVSHLLHGDATQPWMADDPALSGFAAEDADTIRATIEDALPGLAAGGRSGNDSRAGWLSEWRRLWPADAARDPQLDKLAGLVERYSGGETDGGGDWSSELQRRALHILRAHREQPVTVFCHLLLSALELHRLRQGLLERALFNDLAAETAA
jgi:hypothetical protein